jgi:hypothetical protein
MLALANAHPTRKRLLFCLKGYPILNFKMQEITHLSKIFCTGVLRQELQVGQSILQTVGKILVI